MDIPKAKAFLEELSALEDKYDLKLRDCRLEYD